MIDNEKVKLMHELALIQKNESHSEKIVNSYFRIDYITKHMVGVLISYTICFLLVFGIIVLCDYTKIINTIEFDNLFEPYKPYIRIYLIGLVIIEFITILVYSFRFSTARKVDRVYRAKLKRLNRKYEDDGSSC